MSWGPARPGTRASRGRRPGLKHPAGRDQAVYCPTTRAQSWVFWRIQPRTAATRVYTPGKRGRPQPKPQLVTPVSTQRPDGSLQARGPPASPWRERGAEGGDRAGGGGGVPGPRGLTEQLSTPPRAAPAHNMRPLICPG